MHSAEYQDTDIELDVGGGLTQDKSHTDIFASLPNFHAAIEYFHQEFSTRRNAVTAIRSLHRGGRGSEGAIGRRNDKGREKFQERWS